MVDGDDKRELNELIKHPGWEVVRKIQTAAREEAAFNMLDGKHDDDEKIKQQQFGIKAFLAFVEHIAKGEPRERRTDFPGQLRDRPERPG